MQLDTKIDFWKITALLSLLVAVFSFYLSDNNNLTIIYVIFIVLFMVGWYMIYLHNKSLFISYWKDSKRTNKSFIRLILPFLVELTRLFFAGFLIFYLFEVMLSFPGHSISRIIGLSVVLIYLFFISIRMNYTPSDRYVVDIELFLILYGFSFLFLKLDFFTQSNNFIFHTLSFISVFENFLWTMLIILLFSSAFKLKYNSVVFGSFKFKKKSSIIKDFIITFIGLIFVFAILIIGFLASDGTGFNESTNCSTSYSYELTQDDSLFNIYKTLVFTENISSVNFTFNGILKQDGEYVSIDLLDDALDKSYLQYFKVYSEEDKTFKFLRLVFKDENIEYLDSLHVSYFGFCN
ncbi:hypothetical protein JXA48_01685 [Candidatus Woesearchaeota archaeon]|nr:hypothetical protein [Candidatus Woesearchaeota archaeon]